MPANFISPCFIDSNIWLYAFVQSSDPAKTTTARSLIQSTQPVLSTQVINEVCVNLLRLAHFSEDQIQHLITSFYEKYPVISLDLSILLLASQLRQRYSLSFWDGPIVASALTAGVSVLYTEDMQHGLIVEDQLQILNPFRTE